MKFIFSSCVFFIITSSVFSQEIEVCSSLSTSSEKRFQHAMGLGIQYQHDLLKRLKVGVGIHYLFNSTNYDRVPYLDAYPNAVAIENVDASVKRFSVRFNLQWLPINHAYFSVSIGPEISINRLWGKEHTVTTVTSPDPWVYPHDETYNYSRIGFGFISKIEIKNNWIKPLSVCLTVRPEVIMGDTILPIGADEIPLRGIINFTEYQMGVKYRFK